MEYILASPEQLPVAAYAPDGTRSERAFPVRSSASENPTSEIELIEAYEDAIVVHLGSACYALLRSGTNAWLFLLFSVLAIAAWLPLILTQWGWSDRFSAAELLIWTMCAGLLTLHAVPAFVRQLRIRFFATRDGYLIFNRRTRKVYQFVLDSGTLGLGKIDGVERYLIWWWTSFLAWTDMYIIEFPWERLQAWEYCVPAGKNSTSSRIRMVYTDPSGLPTERGFWLGQHLGIEAANLAEWEHLRQYMEADGPALRAGTQLEDECAWQGLVRSKLFWIVLVTDLLIFHYGLPTWASPFFIRGDAGQHSFVAFMSSVAIFMTVLGANALLALEQLCCLSVRLQQRPYFPIAELGGAGRRIDPKQMPRADRC